MTEEKKARNEKRKCDRNKKNPNTVLQKFQWIDEKKKNATFSNNQKSQRKVETSMTTTTVERKKKNRNSQRQYQTQKHF